MYVTPRALRRVRSAAFVSSVVALGALASGCSSNDEPGRGSDDITNVNHTDVERQSIGNCWIYAAASWVESMNLSATAKPFDVSQSYWTYWNWFDQIVEGNTSKLSTGGQWSDLVRLVNKRGLMAEADFVPEDATSEMSQRQSTALNNINAELDHGRLQTYSARTNPTLVRQVIDESWALSQPMRDTLTKVFGADSKKTLDGSGNGGGAPFGGGTSGTKADSSGTTIVPATKFPAAYTQKNGSTTTRMTTLEAALKEWRAIDYPTFNQRAFQIRMERALLDAQPVVIGWQVDFNAMENTVPEYRGSFNLTTLKKAGPGRQGQHMVVLEDMQVKTDAYGVVKAGVTLDPRNQEDAKKLEATLDPTSQVVFFRIKNSWGALRDDRSSIPGFPGYHDLYLDYLNGPVQWCPDQAVKTKENCKGSTIPLQFVVLPPGY